MCLLSECNACLGTYVSFASAELLLSYGNKSNTELLFHYGFIDEDNPHDCIALPLPLFGSVDAEVDDDVGMLLWV